MIASEPTRLTLGEVLADSRVMAARQLRKTLRKPVYVIFAFVQPVMFVLLFRFVFGGAIDTGDVDYVDFLMPGIIVQTAVFGALMTGIGLNTDVATGVVDRFRSLPISRSAVLFGRTAADIVQNVMTLIVMMLVGIAVGFRPSEPVWSIAFALLIVLAFSYTFSWISAFVGLSVKDPETAQSAGTNADETNVSGNTQMKPAESMPDWLEAFANIKPITLVVDTVRALMIGEGEVTGPLLGTTAWLVGLLAVFVPLSMRAFRRA